MVVLVVDLHLMVQVVEVVVQLLLEVIQLQLRVVQVVRVRAQQLIHLRLLELQDLVDL